MFCTDSYIGIIDDDGDISIFGSTSDNDLGMAKIVNKSL
jgi:hypothetical protein